MITSPLIEKYAIEGKCTWRTFNTGLSSTYTIPVPKGSFILLRQIIVYPYINNLGVNRNKRAPHIIQLTLIDQGGSNELTYIVRMKSQNDGDIKTRTVGEPIQIETWQTFKKLACIDIGTIPSPAAYTFAGNDNFQAQAQERTTPLGYNTIAVPPTIDLFEIPGKNLYPTGQSRQFAITPYQAGAIDRLRFNFNANSIVPAPSNDTTTADFETPLITFGYWEFKNGIPMELF